MLYTPLKIIMLLSLLGIIISLATLYLHYMPINSEGICEVGDWFSCSTVNKSAYSRFFDIPVSIVGFAGYSSLFVLSLLKIGDIDVFSKSLLIIFILSMTGVAFTAYLTYIELFVLQAICIFCTVSALITFSIFFSALHLFRKSFNNLQQ